MREFLRLGTAFLALSGLLMGAPAWSAENAQPPDAQTASSCTAGMRAQQIVDAAVEAVKKMRRDPEVQSMLARAQGVYIVPCFDAAAAQGSDGVLLTRDGRDWSAPVFYQVAGIAPKAGKGSGALAMVLTTRIALSRFRRDEKFTLNPVNYLSIIDYAGSRPMSRKGKDIIVWSDMSDGASGLSVDAADITVDSAQNAAYYQSANSVGDILDGKVRNPDAEPLKAILPG